MTAKALVLGVGNILMQDEGIGVRVVEWLQDHYYSPYVELLDGGTMGLELLHYLEGVDHLLVVDAINANKEPGEIITLTGEAVPTFLSMKVSPHQIGVQDLLVTAQLKGYTPPSVVIMGVQPAQLNISLEMSPEVTVQVEPLGHKVIAQLEKWHYTNNKNTHI